MLNLTNSLIEGSPYEAKLLQWKRKHGIHMDQDASLVGRKWFGNFIKRNPDLATKYGKKFPHNRNDETNYSTFTKMGDQTEDCFVESGNARRLDEPVHMGINGERLKPKSVCCNLSCFFINYIVYL